MLGACFFCCFSVFSLHQLLQFFRVCGDKGQFHGRRLEPHRDVVSITGEQPVSPLEVFDLVDLGGGKAQDLAAPPPGKGPGRWLFLLPVGPPTRRQVRRRSPALFRQGRLLLFQRRLLYWQKWPRKSGSRPDAAVYPSFQTVGGFVSEVLGSSGKSIPPCLS